MTKKQYKLPKRIPDFAVTSHIGAWKVRNHFVAQMSLKDKREITFAIKNIKEAEFKKYAERHIFDKLAELYANPLSF